MKGTGGILLGNGLTLRQAQAQDHRWISWQRYIVHKAVDWEGVGQYLAPAFSLLEHSPA
jgi:hypothetical protein